MGYVKLNNSNLITANTLVDNVVRPLAPVTTEFADTGGTNNGIFVNATLQRPVISMSIYITGATHREAHQRLRDVAAKVTCLKPTKLQFEDDGDLYYMVVSKGARTVIDNIDSLRLDCSFESVYPWMLGPVKELTLTRGSETLLDFGGNVQAPLYAPNQTMSATSTDGGITLYYSNNQTSTTSSVTFAIPGTKASRELSFDKMALLYGNVPYYPTSGSVLWPETGTDGKIRLRVPASSISGAETTLKFRVTPRWL